MSKFYILVITADMKLQRMWTDVSTIATILTENKDTKVYRCSNDQEAKLVDNTIMWVDVPTVEKV